jgi:hypothetical protein
MASRSMGAPLEDAKDVSAHPLNTAPPAAMLPPGCNSVDSGTACALQVAAASATASSVLFKKATSIRMDARQVNPGRADRTAVRRHPIRGAAGGS